MSKKVNQEAVAIAAFAKAETFSATASKGKEAPKARVDCGTLVGRYRALASTVADAEAELAIVKQTITSSALTALIAANEKETVKSVQVTGDAEPLLVVYSDRYRSLSPAAVAAIGSLPDAARNALYVASESVSLRDGVTLADIRAAAGPSADAVCALFEVKEVVAPGPSHMDAIRTVPMGDALRAIIRTRCHGDGAQQGYQVAPSVRT
jgi:hypothetical protein